MVGNLSVWLTTGLQSLELFKGKRKDTISAIALAGSNPTINAFESPYMS